MTQLLTWVSPDVRGFQVRTEVKNEVPAITQILQPLTGQPVKVGPWLPCTCIKPWQIAWLPLAFYMAERQVSLFAKKEKSQLHKSKQKFAVGFTRSGFTEVLEATNIERNYSIYKNHSSE